MMSNAPRVLIIGAGVIGLTTALCLRKQGAKVTVIADRFSPDLTSVVAGALWEWPPAVCGNHQDQKSLERSKMWSMHSYKVFTELAKNSAIRSETGVYLRPAVFYFHHAVSSDKRDQTKMEELRDRVLGFRHDASLIQKYEVNPECGFRDAYEYLAPMVDTDVYMQWLRDAVEREGCALIRQQVESELSICAPALMKQFSSDFIVNCTGLGAKELGDDSVYPLRGALLRVINNSLPGGKLQVAHCVSHDESKNIQDIVFIVPRGENMIVLGGLVESDQWSTDISLENYAPIRDMLDRCVKFLPRLRGATIDPAEPVRAGLRPARRQNVRLEADPQDERILHCYGHGGSGITFSWGCAQEVAAMIFSRVSQQMLPSSNYLMS